MIVDSSALVAIVRGEPESAECFRALVDSPRIRISAANLFESAVVVDGWRDPDATREFDALIAGFAMVVEPFTAQQASIASEAYRRFGKGTGHPARLNFGDCFAYALAKDFDEPLLFVGQDLANRYSPGADVNIPDSRERMANHMVFSERGRTRCRQCAQTVA